MAEHKLVDGVQVVLSDAEIAQRQFGSTAEVSADAQCRTR